jgi:hypothetical protein
MGKFGLRVEVDADSDVVVVQESRGEAKRERQKGDELALKASHETSSFPCISAAGECEGCGFLVDRFLRR